MIGQWSLVGSVRQLLSCNMTILALMGKQAMHTWLSDGRG